jgi:hypothetical protein
VSRNIPKMLGLDIRKGIGYSNVYRREKAK